MIDVTPQIFSVVCNLGVKMTYSKTQFCHLDNMGVITVFLPGVLCRLSEIIHTKA